MNFDRRDIQGKTPCHYSTCSLYNTFKIRFVKQKEDYNYEDLQEASNDARSSPPFYRLKM